MHNTPEEIDWIEEHGCVHGLYPDEDPIFCPNCKPDLTDLKHLLRQKCQARGMNNEKTI